jgi:hypothetical protein
MGDNASILKFLFLDLGRKIILNGWVWLKLGEKSLRLEGK